MILRNVLILWMVMAGLLMSMASPASAQSAPKREIYAHYMGCYPVGTSALAYAYRRQTKELDPQKLGDFPAQIGGSIVGWPLVPQQWFYDKDNLQRSAELEIRRAMRIGIDGFAIDAWAGGDGAKKMVDIFMEICNRDHLPFYITICLDPSCIPVKTDHYDDTGRGHVQGMHDTVRYMLSKYRDNPNLARRDGKPLIFTYATVVFESTEDKSLGGGKDEPARWRKMLELLDGLRQMARKEFNTDLFVHYDMDNAFNNVDLKNIKGSILPRDPGPMMADLASYLVTGDGNLQGYDAIGGFLGSAWEQHYERIAQRVHAAGKTWSIPMSHQYNNVGGSLHVELGTDQLRRYWDMARKTNSDLIQYVTWNDYGENTTLAPTTESRYTVYDLTGYQIAWWKTGKQPAVDHDKLYLIYRRYPEGARTYPFHIHRAAPGVLEVATILTAPATISLPGRDVSYQAPAGLYTRQFPLKVGQVAAQVLRDGKVELNVISPDPVSDKPWREDLNMVCYSSEYERQWKMDFPDTPPQTYAEYGDDDHDGLPNWFEMLWFGRLGDYTTATAADPNADPDGDGLTNLQAYQQQSNPLQKATPYSVGQVWDFSAVNALGMSFRYDPDDKGIRVWQYLYKLGEPPIHLDGDYQNCPVSSPRPVPYAGSMVQHIPYSDPRLTDVYGWIARHKNPDDGSWMIQLRPGANSAAIIAWESPIAGSVRLDLTTVARQDRRGKAMLTVQRTGPLKTLESVEVPGNQAVQVHIPTIKVQPGDRLYIIGADPKRNDVMIGTLKIELINMEQSAATQRSH